MDTVFHLGHVLSCDLSDSADIIRATWDMVCNIQPDRVVSVVIASCELASCSQGQAATLALQLAPPPKADVLLGARIHANALRRIRQTAYLQLSRVQTHWLKLIYFVHSAYHSMVHPCGGYPAKL